MILEYLLYLAITCGLVIWSLWGIHWSGQAKTYTRFKIYVMAGFTARALGIVFLSGPLFWAILIFILPMRIYRSITKTKAGAAK